MPISPYEQAQHHVILLPYQSNIQYQITSKYSDRVINTAMLYDEVSSEYSDIFLNDSDLNGVACSTHINILLAKMVRKKFLERKRKFDDQETSYIATEKGEHALKVLDNLPLKSPHNDKSAM